MKEIVKHFRLPGKFQASTQFGEGHINQTYLIETNDNGETLKYILQKVNNFVFKDIELLMRNIEAVTSFIRKKVIEIGGDPDRECLTIIPTIYGKSFYHDETGCYRMYNFIKDVLAFQTVEREEIFYNTGYAIGKFQSLLSGFNTNLIQDVIPNFHNTVLRYKAFCNVVKEDKLGRVKSCEAEIEFIHRHQEIMGTIVNALATKAIPLRVTHNDTKLNNILFDKNTLKGLCIVDLDTIMKGSLLYDFGDAIRFGANTAAEDETDLTKVQFNFELFKTFTRGFLEAIEGDITELEIELLPLSSILMTLECGMRFLTDYIEGDVYFKIHRPFHNLERARNQLKLVNEMEKQEVKMNEFVQQFLTINEPAKISVRDTILI